MIGTLHFLPRVDHQKQFDGQMSDHLPVKPFPMIEQSAGQKSDHLTIKLFPMIDHLPAKLIQMSNHLPTKMMPMDELSLTAHSVCTKLAP